MRPTARVDMQVTDARLGSHTIRSKVFATPPPTFSLHVSMPWLPSPPSSLLITKRLIDALTTKQSPPQLSMLKLKKQCKRPSRRSLRTHHLRHRASTRAADP